jgi:excisionase family DNA binding protein
MSAGDSLVEAIAEAVAQRLETMAACNTRLMGIEAAAQYLGMTESALRIKCSAGELPTVRIDHKLRFDRRDLDRYIDRAPREGI